MREAEKNYGHADIVNRRARFFVVILVLLIGLFVGVNALGDDSGDGVADSALTTPPVSVLAASVGTTSTTTGQEPAQAGSSTTTNAESTTSTAPITTISVAAGTTTTTATQPSTTTSTRPTTTTTKAPPTTTTTTKPPPTTTTTTTPPTTTTTSTTTTTTSTTTTTVPPTTTTTTTTPPNAWFPILDAQVLCDSDELFVQWSVFDPDQEWSNGWQLVIDRDSRGEFPPGTIVTADGGPAVTLEQVSPGSQTLTIDVHWELIPSGTQDRGFGTFSITVIANAQKCD